MPTEEGFCSSPGQDSLHCSWLCALLKIDKLYTSNWVIVFFLGFGVGFFFFVDNRIVLQMCLKGALRSAESCGETATVQSGPAEVYQH